MSLSKNEQERCDKWFFSWIKSDEFHEVGTWKELVEKIWEAAIDEKDDRITDLEVEVEGERLAFDLKEKYAATLKTQVVAKDKEIEALKARIAELENEGKLRRLGTYVVSKRHD